MSEDVTEPGGNCTGIRRGREGGGGHLLEVLVEEHGDGRSDDANEEDGGGDEAPRLVLPFEVPGAVRFVSREELQCGLRGWGAGDARTATECKRSISAAETCSIGMGD